MANDTPRTKEKEVRTAEIEQAARKIFLSRGFQAATIQEIAEEAGIAKGTVYLYYQSKEDLYTALLLPSLEFLNGKANALLDEVEGERFATGEALFEALADMFVELQRRDPEIAIIYEGFQLGAFASAVSKQTLDRLNGFGRRNFQAFRAIFEKGVELGLLRDLDVVKAVDAVWGLMLGISQVEWAKLQVSGKNHFEGTLRYALSMMKGMCAAPRRASRKGSAGRRARGRDGRARSRAR
jgi:AcrR family transcriptional regulator